MGRFETELLSSRKNLKALMDLPGTWIDLVQACAPRDKPILDLDCSQSETYGAQPGSAHNGHFECLCYHPLFLFNQRGDLERANKRASRRAAVLAWIE